MCNVKRGEKSRVVKKIYGRVCEYTEKVSRLNTVGK